MNTTYRVNAQVAVNKALEAVRSWEGALLEQTAKGDLEGIEFCKRSLEASKGNLELVKESVKRVHEWN
jgi:hypothetical protein